MYCCVVVTLVGVWFPFPILGCARSLCVYMVGVSRFPFIEKGFCRTSIGRGGLHVAG